MSVVNSVSINGLPGTGKTFATAKIVTELGLNAFVFDFEGMYHFTIDEYFKDFVGQFEVYNVMKPTETPKTAPTLREGRKVIQADMKITFRHAPDYIKSCADLIEKMNEVLDRSDINVIIMDGATPIIRNQLGLAYWKQLHPGRAAPEPVEWGAMNDFEQSFIEGGVGWAKENNGLFIVTGQMKDEYKGDKKVGDVPGISVKCRHSINVVIELQKNVYRDHTDYICVVDDSIKGSFMTPITLEKHVFDVLIEKGLLSY